VAFGEMAAVLWAQKKYDCFPSTRRTVESLAQTQFFYLCCAYPASGFQGKFKGEPSQSVQNTAS
jgi:hypothetical protein